MLCPHNTNKETPRNSSRVPIRQVYLGVEWRAWVLFYTKDIEVKGCLELGMRYVSLLESETSWTDKSFVFRRFPREALTDKSDLRRAIQPTTETHVHHIW